MCRTACEISNIATSLPSVALRRASDSSDARILPTYPAGSRPPRGEDTAYHVRRMPFGGTAKQKDKSTVIYNENITLQGIPLEVYDYIVNGKPALAWVMERQAIRADKDSGIVNNANRYAVEIKNNPAFHWGAVPARHHGQH